MPTNDQSDAKIETVGDYIRNARERSGLSQRQLAQRIGVHHSGLARLENGESRDRIKPELWQRIADELDLDVSDVLAFVGITPSQKLPSVRVYFRRKLGVDADEAEVLANLVEAYQNRAQNNPREEDS